MRLAQSQMANMSPEQMMAQLKNMPPGMLPPHMRSGQMKAAMDMMSNNPDMFKQATAAMKNMTPEQMASMAKMSGMASPEEAPAGSVRSSPASPAKSSPASPRDVQSDLGKRVDKLKKQGNDHFGKEEYDEANAAYENAVSELIEHMPNAKVSAAEKAALLVLKDSLQLNLAASLLKQNSYRRAARECTEVLTRNLPDGASSIGSLDAAARARVAKASFRRAQARMALAGNDAAADSDYVTGAKSDLSLCLRLDPDDLTVQGAMKAFETQYPTPVASSSPVASADDASPKASSPKVVFDNGSVSVEDVSDEVESPPPAASVPLSSPSAEAVSVPGLGELTPEKIALAREQMSRMSPDQLKQQATMMKSMDLATLRSMNPAMANLSDEQIKASIASMEMMAENPAMMEFARAQMASMTPETLKSMQMGQSSASASPTASAAPRSSSSSESTDVSASPFAGGPAGFEEMAKSFGNGMPSNPADMMKNMKPEMLSEMMGMLQKNPEMLKMAMQSNPQFSQMAGGMSPERLQQAMDQMAKMSPEQLQSMMQKAEKLQRIVGNATGAWQWLDQRTGGNAKTLAVAGAALLLYQLLHWVGLF